MNITIIAVGTVKEAYLRGGVQEYMKRLTPYCIPGIVEIAEEKLPMNPSPEQIKQGMEKEGERIIKALPKSSRIVCLCVEGKELDSVSFAKSVKKWEEEGGSRLTFIIGGSYGLSEEVKKLGVPVSFSKLTFPHQLMRMILLEQIYRSFRILNGEPYHK